MKTREIAYRIVEEVEVKNAYLNLTLPRYLQSVQSNDAGFITELVSGMYRNRGFLDFVIRHESNRDIEKIDPPLRDILRLGAYQILFMRTENYAAVSETVNLISLTRLASAKGFLNATLRSISEHDLTFYYEIILREVHTGWDQMSMRYSHPLWIVKAAAEALHVDESSVKSLLDTNNAPPPVTLVSRRGAFSAETESRYSPYAMRIRENPYQHPLVIAGEAQVQDEGSQLVAQLLAHYPLDGKDDAWLDLCSGPGGKAMLLKQIAALRSAAVTAVELHPHRAQLVEETLAGIPGKSDVIIADGRDQRFAKGTFDRVLVDAPCTGLGALRRRAESRWRKQASDLTALVPLQKGLLGNALNAIRPGGIVGYATCSWHLAETEFLIDDILKDRSDVTLLNAQLGVDAIPGLKHVEELVGSDSYFRLWPHIHDTDGMFMAILTRE